MSLPFIGSRITLTTHALIRYEGILTDISSENSTVTLKDVRSYGTEDRNLERVIPPHANTFQFIVFKGNDILDLQVTEPANPPTMMSQDPAILEAQEGPAVVEEKPAPAPARARASVQHVAAPAPAAAPSRSASNPWGTNKGSSQPAGGSPPGGGNSGGNYRQGPQSNGAFANRGARPSVAAGAPAPVVVLHGGRGGDQQQHYAGDRRQFGDEGQHSQFRQQPQPQQQYNNGYSAGRGGRGGAVRGASVAAGRGGRAAPGASTALPGRGESLVGLATIQGGAGGGVSRDDDKKTDFDLQAANAKFDKEAELAKFKGTEHDGPEDVVEVKPVVAPAYDKSKSFFDSLTSGQGGAPGSYRRDVERALNGETFGAVGLSHGAGGYFRGRGSYHHNNRGGGRGGYGGGGGGGGYNSGGGWSSGGGGGYNAQRSTVQ